MVPPINNVFVGGTIRFTEVDAYYHMRLIDNLVANFPHRMIIDPFNAFPTKESFIAWPPLFDYIIATPAKIFGHLDLIAVFIPVILGVLTIIPVYFIAKKLFGKVTALFAAVLIAVLPGPFLNRTSLGYVDHHALETLLVACIMLFAILMNNKKWYDWRGILCGVFMGLFVWTWNGAQLIALILFIAISLKFILKRESTLNYSLAFIFPLIAAYLLPASNRLAEMIIPAFIVCVIAPIVYELLLKLKGKSFYIAISVIALSIIAVVIKLDGHLFAQANAQLGYIFAWSFSGVGEMVPLLFASNAVLTYFTLSIFTALFATFIILFKYNNSSYLIFIIWSVTIALAAFAQQRYSYYLAVNIAILSAFFISYVISRVNKKVFVGALLSIFIILPNIPVGIALLSYDKVITNDWYDSMIWLKANSPDPGVNYDKIVSYDYEFPESSYGVLCWWDYGYFVTQIAQRPAISSPSVYGVSAPFFVGESPISVKSRVDDPINIIREYKVGYIVVNKELIKELFPSLVFIDKVKLSDYIKDGQYTQKYYDTPAYQLWNNTSDLPVELVYSNESIKIYEVVK